MKKLLILILIALVLTLTIFTMVNGLGIGGLKILGIKQIQDKNTELEKSVTEATKLASSTFPSKVSEVNSSMKKLQEQKKSYEDMVNVSDSGDVSAASRLSKYNLDFLWARIGTHATSEGVNIDMSLTQGTGEKNVYNINFTAVGSYVGISEFIRDVEDDSNLAFKIEEFSMSTGQDNALKATFVCKNIPIEGVSSIDSKASATPDDANTAGGNSNTANATGNSTTNSNTANATGNANSNNTNTTKNNTANNASANNTAR